MTDVILVHPKVVLLSDLVSLPISLISISRLLDAEGYKIKIIDQRVNSNWKKELIKELKKNPVCVGISTMTGNSILSGLTASKLVKENSDVPVVWGGPHPSILPQLTLENEYVDIVCEGEGEVTFYELAKTLEKDKSLSGVKGIWYKENGNIKRNEKRSFVDLNTLPDPPYNILDIKNYKNTSWQISEYTINIETSRGCPHRCAYCYNPNLYPFWRALKPERVVELLKKLVDKYKIGSFLFHDDNFFVNQKRTNEIMEGILREGLDIVMGFQGMRVDTLYQMKKSELDLLYKAGCKYFNFGLETGSPRILKLIEKGTTLKQAYSINKRLAKYPDIKPHYNFMSGFPTETIEEMFMTMNMTVKLKRENPNAQIPIIFLFIPWPKTKIYDLALQYGFVPPKSLEEWGYIEWGSISKDCHKFRPWLTEDFIKMYKKLLLTHQLVYYPAIAKFTNFIIKILTGLYGPIAKFRYRHKFYRFMPEMILAEYIDNIIRPRESRCSFTR